MFSHTLPGITKKAPVSMLPAKQLLQIKGFPQRSSAGSAALCKQLGQCQQGLQHEGYVLSPASLSMSATRMRPL